MRIVIAIDSFKGCLTSKEANLAAADAVRRFMPDAETLQVAVSDGGEGFVEAFHTAIGGDTVEVMTRDPLMRPIPATYLLHDTTAVIETAQASRLTLLADEERNPLVATSYGTGLLVADAVRRGSRHVIVGLGGSAVSDCGIGMLRALIDSFAKHGTWDDIHALHDVRFTIATDVTNPLYGEHGAARVFAPQKCPKGQPTPELITLLDQRARRFAEHSARHFGYDHSRHAGAGAAGGLGYAFLQYLHADCKPGTELLLDAVRFTDIVADADLVITGEGSADRQTLMGKLPAGILRHAGRVPVYLIAGRVTDEALLLRAGFSRVACINPPSLSPDDAMRREVAIRNIGETVCRLL